jgi:single-stranded DNA-binding protein
MTAFVLVSGSLWKTPEQRSSSKTGRVFVTATLRVGAENGNGEFWQMTAFSQSVQSELLRLSAGDALSCQGKLEIKTYTAADGTTKVGRSIVADSVLALHAPPREKKPTPHFSPTIFLLGRRSDERPDPKPRSDQQREGAAGATRRASRKG